MSSYLIDQEAWLAFYAERIGVDPANLGERDIRLGLALYHAAYLPAAATIELRLNELDLLQRYAEFGFVPDVPSAATGKVKVVIQNPAVNSYTLMAPFVVTQGDLRFVATEALTIPAGGTIGMATIRAELQGVDGTPQEAAASITVSAGPPCTRQVGLMASSSSGSAIGLGWSAAVVPSSTKATSGVSRLAAT